MAPTFRPYQSVGRGLNRLNLPQGAEAQEASRTMSVLSQSMDRMSNFFLRQANEQAKVEGSKFGVENAPDIATLRKAYKQGKDTSDMLEFGNTTFGKSARESALRVLQNEAMIEGTKIINDTVFNAVSNKTAPPTLQKQLDASILGLSSAITASSPELGELIKSKLVLQGVGEFDRYRTAYAKGSIGSLSAKGRANVNTYLNSLPSRLTATLNAKNMTPELFKLELLNIQKEGLLEFATNGYVKTALETKINEQDKIVKDWFLNEFSDEIFNRDLDNTDSIKTPFILLEQIRKGKYTGNDAQAKLIMDYMKIKDKGGILVPTLGELQKRISEDYTRKIANENSEIALGNRRADEKKKSQILILDDILNKSTQLTQEDKNKARIAIKSLKDGGHYKEADEYEDTLSPLSINKAHPPRSEDQAKADVQALLNSGRINYGLLNKYKYQLSSSDYQTFFEETRTSLDERVVLAIEEIKTAVQLDYKSMVYADQKDDTQYEIRKARQAEAKLRKEMLKARRAGTEVNPLEIVVDIIEEANFSVADDIRKDNMKKAIRNVNNVIQNFNKKKEDDGTEFDEGFIRGANDEETIRNWLSILQSWENFRSLEEVPEMYRHPYILEWFKDNGWKEEVQRQIRKMEKALPSE